MCRRGRLWCKMRYYDAEEKFVKVCEGLWSGDKGCDEQR